MCKWLAKHAEELGVEVYSGFAANELLFNKNNYLEGIATADMGRDKKGNPKEGVFQPGIEIRANQTIIAEGARGFLAQKLIKHYKLDQWKDGERKVAAQTYGIGMKEIWQLPEGHKMYSKGKIMHSVGWPFDLNTYGGTFMYHQADRKIYTGLVVGLDYTNPWLSPYQTFQQFKTHPFIRTFLEGGECIAYGARALNEGGFYSIPKLTFPGGMMIGCSAGFLNVPKIKGVHNAMKSGILAAEATAEAILNDSERYPRGKGREIFKYYDLFKKSPIYEELNQTRNIRSCFENGNIPGMITSGMSLNVTKGGFIEPTKLSHSKKDSLYTLPANNNPRIEYPKPDNKLTFDILTNVNRTNTFHEEDQPCHLQIKKDMDRKPLESWNKFKGVEQRFCPAGVYEFLDDKNGDKFLQINAQNCIHCKTCDIKTPWNYIEWTCPEGGGGPNYGEM